MKYTNVNIVKVYNMEEEVYLEVTESGNYVMVQTNNDENIRYYGIVDLRLPKEQARLLGEALILLSKEDKK